MTSAPQSAQMAPQEGTKVHDATSRTRTPANTSYISIITASWDHDSTNASHGDAAVILRHFDSTRHFEQLPPGLADARRHVGDDSGQDDVLTAHDEVRDPQWTELLDAAQGS